MQPAAQVLRPRQTQTCGVRIDSGEVLGGNITDQDVGHTATISADIMLSRPDPCDVGSHDARSSPRLAPRNKVLPLGRDGATRACANESAGLREIQRSR